MLTVHVAGAGGPGVLAQLERLSGGRVVAVDDPVRAAISLAVRSADRARSPLHEVDAVIIDGGVAQDVAEQVDQLWEQRLAPWLAILDAGREPSAPAAPAPHDPSWTGAATWHLRRVRAALASLLPPGAEVADDHIGSTAVPGLIAKPFVDLQVRMPALPPAPRLDAALACLGYLPALGSRPDSPGVHHDVPRGSEDVPESAWVKRLFFCPDPVQPVILYLRLAASPFGRYTVWFRDWLRAHPDDARRYGEIKTELAARHADDSDYDDYTRAKTDYLDGVQARFEAWARSR